MTAITWRSVVSTADRTDRLVNHVHAVRLGEPQTACGKRVQSWWRWTDAAVTCRRCQGFVERSEQ